MICKTIVSKVLGLAFFVGCGLSSPVVLGAASVGVEPLRLYLSPQGDDEATGRTPTDPFRTLERARDAIRSLKQDSSLDRPVEVCFAGGIYPLRDPVVFTAQDSGSLSAPITYRALEGEEPVLSGGQRIGGWRDVGEGLWTTRIPEVEAGQWWFNQLFVNGRSRQRARAPNDGFLRVAGFPDGGNEVNYHTDCQRFEYAPGDLNPDWTNIEDVEVIVYHFWTDSHLPIQSLDVDNRIVTFKHKAGKVFTDDFTGGGARYVVEHVFEGLDQPGEWYLNRQTGVLYYRPLPGETLDAVEVIAPRSPALLRLEGGATERQFVEHLTFRGLSFEYTNFQLPIGDSNDRQGSAGVPAAITLSGARHCTFDHCSVGKLGTFAFELKAGCRYNEFSHNNLTYLGAGGFRVDGGTQTSHPLLRTGHNVIRDNRLHHFGEVYPSAVGILLMHTDGNQVIHNAVHHGWYTGISVGWTWGYQRSVSRDNIIAHNHIHDIGQGLLSDMGAIYTLGVSPGTVIANNLIHDVEANHYGGWGIYNDEGSTHLLIESNIVYRTKFAGYNIHFSKEVSVRNNIFALGRLQQLSRSRVEPHKSVFFENNIVYWKEGKLLDTNWKSKPYLFYFHPKNEKGTREVTDTFDIDWNLYFNPNLDREEIELNGLPWDIWREMGRDRHSLYADPLFVDPEAGDFRLSPDSPAWGLGFQPIDMSQVGPRSGP